MKRILALLLLLPLLTALPAAPGRAQSGPPRASDADLAEPSTVCQQVLADPSVSVTQATTPWREYRRARLISTDEKLSSPQSISMVANRDGDPASGPDIDAVGQEITVTASLAELYGTLNYFYTSAAPGDELRVELYEVGNITPSGLITTAAVLTGTDRVEGSWQSLYWEVLDPASISRLRTLGRAALVFSSVSAASPGAQRLWLDDLTASTCALAGSLGGKVTRGGVGLPNAAVRLAHTAAGATSIVATQHTDASGFYSFPAVPVLAADESYRLWFVSQPATPPSSMGVMGFWAGPRVGALAAGQTIDNLSFDVAGVDLLTPVSYSELVGSDADPVVLRWGGRAVAGERQRACIYDPERADLSTKLPLTYCGPALDPSRDELAFSLRPGSLPSSFGFTYGRSYRWYVEVYDRDPASPEAQYGYSFDERAITLLSAPLPEPPEAATPEPGDPTAGVSNADWTLLIYMAADNTIGDPRRAPNLGRPSGQLASLPTLATAYPKVNLVSYADRYGPDGIELCVYPPGAAPDCRVRAEANTADPQTLAGFIAYGRQRYPAAHTALLIVAPGQAAGQLALDETAPGGPAMSLAGLDAAYQAASLGGTTKLDLVLYQVPLLGSVEALQTTAPYAHYMVASAGQVWQLGPYRELLPLLGGASRYDVAAVARGAVAAYGTTTAAVGGVRATTWAAYDLGRAAALGQAIDALATALKPGITSDASRTRPEVAAARDLAQSYDASGNGHLDALETSGAPLPLEEDSLVDLRDLAEVLSTTAGAEAYVSEEAANLLALLDSTTDSPIIARVIRSGQSTSGDQIDLSQARGLSIFFPGGDRLGGQATLAESYLYTSLIDPPGDSQWADMLRVYQAGALASGPGGVTEGAGGGAQLRPLPGGFVSTTLYMPILRR